jgi:phage tail-like protein
LYEWIDRVRAGDIGLAKRTVQVKLLNETRRDVVVTWTLRGAMPLKWTGPSLAAKGGGDVAIEEFVLSVESLEQD